jgi:2-oxoglutarate ferredoxin oxidoreductase subunit beta
LTKGQASPTTDQGYNTKIQREGVILNRFNSLAVAIASGCGFVARGFSRQTDDLAELMVKAIKHRGFSLLEVMQPCVSFNKVNTYEWYAERLYKVEEDSSYNPKDMEAALIRSFEWGDKIPMGIIYHSETDTYQDRIGKDKNPFLNQNYNDISEILEDFV